MFSVWRLYFPPQAAKHIYAGLRQAADAGMFVPSTVCIKSMTKLPRSPCWMFLDYAIWNRIMEKVFNTVPEGRESKKEFFKRLRKCAMALPRRWVATQIANVKTRIKGVKDAGGYHAKRD